DRRAERLALRVDVVPGRRLALGADLVVGAPELLHLRDRVADADAGEADAGAEDAVGRQRRLARPVGRGRTLPRRGAHQRDDRDGEGFPQGRGDWRNGGRRIPVFLAVLNSSKPVEWKEPGE